MKFMKFFFEKELTLFDFVCITLISNFAMKYSLWIFLLVIPSILVSVILTTHFQVKEKLES
jgi:hypothetical protein